MGNSILDVIKLISPLQGEASASAAEHLDRLTKPPGSLGKLETLAVQLAGITGQVRPSFDKRAIIVMAADHGVCEEGISAFPAEVTPQMVLNFLAGGAAINVFARQAAADVLCVDIGVNAELSHPDLLVRKIRMGTANMAVRPAMSRAEAEAAVLAGIAVVKEAVNKGTTLFVTGEMGIGNTTASAAVMSVLTGIAPMECVGRGTGIDEPTLRHKASVVERAIALNQPDAQDPLDVLSKVGGLEIAGLTGVILGAAAHRCPVVIDGFISSVAALIAKGLCAEAVNYMVASHHSQEPGHIQVLRELGLSPMLELDMRLGEGTGGALALHLIDGACRIMKEMATFESAGISSGEPSAGVDTR
ncbi:Nicotinate-nucleotide--dimethylbenzimidazole phosphoribosyltransferase [compost metagenome]